MKDPVGTADIKMNDKGLWDVEWCGKLLCSVSTLNEATAALSEFGFVGALRRGATRNRPAWTTQILPRRKNNV